MTYTDLFWMVCKGKFLGQLTVLPFLLWLEVLLNNRSEVVDCMISNGILHVIGDVIVSEMDPLVLVRFTSFSFWVYIPSFDIYCLTFAESYASLILWTCWRMHIGTERRRYETRYDWEYPEDNDGFCSLDSFFYLLIWLYYLLFIS